MAIVTVVIPLYNKQRQIERAIRSVQRQTFRDWRLLVVDDGSTDRGPQVVRGIQDSRIEMVHQENAGPGAARNTGIRMAQTRYVAFLDADDEWHPEFLEVTLKAIQENNVVMVSATTIELPQGNDTLDILKRNNIEPGIFYFEGNEDPEKARVIISMIQAKSTLMVTDIAVKYGCFFDKNKCLFGEDNTFLWRVAFSEKFMIIGPALAIYHTEDSALGPHTTARPLEPYLKNSNVLLDYCPKEKHKLIKSVLDILALRRILNQARHGLRLQSFCLLMRHPGAIRYRPLYCTCLKQILPGYLLWCKIKNNFRNFVSKRKRRRNP